MQDASEGVFDTVESVKVSPEVEERFWDKVLKISEDGCWLWIAGKVSKGYGAFSPPGKTQWAAHRFSFLLRHGRIKRDAYICHTCDVPACVNPAHLWEGTHEKNMADMVAKNRSATGERNASCLYPEKRKRGELHPKAILTAELVREIRRLRKEGVFIKQIAKQLNTSWHATYDVLRNRTWRHVKEQ
jgi:hypothetical protein